MSFFFRKRAAEDSANYPTAQTSNVSTLPYDPAKIFILNQSEDGNLQLFRELYQNQSAFKIFFSNSKEKIFIAKEYPHSEHQSINVFRSSLSDTGFAVVIDTYFSDNPKTILDLFLYDNSGEELFHIYYQCYGPRKFDFSDSGRYFILLDHTNFYIYDMILKNLSTFSPEDIGNSDFTDFTILEDKKLISYCYTQHPDKPFYHFDFRGRLVEEDVFRTQVNKLDELDAETQRYYALLEEIDSAEKPLSKENREKYMTELKAYASNPKYIDSAWLYRRMGEIELDAGNKIDALVYLEKALSLNSQIGVKRLVSKLKKEL